jgi:hypothetical protein
MPGAHPSEFDAQQWSREPTRLRAHSGCVDEEGLPVRLRPGSSDRRSALAYGDSEVFGDTFSRLRRCEVGVVHTQVLVGVEEFAAGAQLMGSVSVEQPDQLRTALDGIRRLGHPPTLCRAWWTLGTALRRLAYGAGSLRWRPVGLRGAVRRPGQSTRSRGYGAA